MYVCVCVYMFVCVCTVCSFVCIYICVCVYYKLQKKKITSKKKIIRTDNQVLLIFGEMC